MSDIVSIELLLDPEAESRVHADWRRLADTGFASPIAHHTAARPHITLMVRPALGEVAFPDAVALLPVRLTLGAPVVFRHGDRCVFARQIVPNEALLGLHRSVHSTAPPGQDAARTTPGDWTPHVTLARRVPLDRLAAALRLLGPDHGGRGVALRRWDSASATATPLG